jgi:hypothetical protein
MHGVGRHPEPLGQDRSSDGPSAFGEDVLEFLEDPGPVGRRIFLGELVERSLEKGQRPVSIEEAVGRHEVDRLEQMESLGVPGVDRDMRDIPTMYPGLPPAVFILEIVEANLPEEVAEPTSLLVGLGERLSLQY